MLSVLAQPLPDDPQYQVRAPPWPAQCLSDGGVQGVGLLQLRTCSTTHPVITRGMDLLLLQASLHAHPFLAGHSCRPDERAGRPGAACTGQRVHLDM